MSVVPIKQNQEVASHDVIAATERIKLCMKRTAEDVISIGTDLILLKKSLSHGEFLPLLEKEFAMSPRTAQRFMGVAEKYGSKCAGVSHLDPKVLYELSSPSTPEPVRKIIEAKAEKGETVSVKEVQELRRQVKETKASLKDAEAKADSATLEVQTLKDSQELAKIKAKEEAQAEAKKELDELNSRLHSEQSKKQKEIEELRKQVSSVQKEAQTHAEKKATDLVKQKLAEKENDLKKLRSNVREAERKIESLDREKEQSRQILKELEDHANKISSADWEAKSLLQKLDELARQMTDVLLEVQGLEHKHSGRTLKVANQTSSMCENLAIALKMVPQIEDVK
ncbi:MAG: hypothetical protein DHS20C07_19250 [Methyloligella sp.]|nr:MAG: hypothetical protein DHS20C07_19250 [Methyloligella sp.]